MRDRLFELKTRRSIAPHGLGRCNTGIARAWCLVSRRCRGTFRNVDVEQNEWFSKCPWQPRTNRWSPRCEHRLRDVIWLGRRLHRRIDRRRGCRRRRFQRPGRYRRCRGNAERRLRRRQARSGRILPRFSGWLMTSKASAASLNLTTASSSPGLRSGWWFHRQFSIGIGDLRLRCVSRHTKHFVIVAFFRH